VNIASVEGCDLCAAGGTVKDPVGQKSHLGVTALASVLAQGVREADYLFESLYNSALNDANTRVAASRTVPVETQLALFAQGADHKVGFGS
jgi:hypothetical protein